MAGKNPIDVHVGSRVRLRRVLIGMSQTELGNRLGLTFQQVQKYEKGLNRIGASRLYEISHVLGVPVTYFFEELEDNSGPDKPKAEKFALSVKTAPAETIATRQGVELNRAFMKIESPRIRRMLIDLVETICVNEEETRKPT